MIEDASIYVNEIEFPTRLHEHGKEPSYQYQPRKDWMYTGYMEGNESTLTFLRNSGSKKLEIYKGGKLEVTLIGVKWGEVVNMYGDHFILHLDWVTEDPKPYYED